VFSELEADAVVLDPSILLERNILGLFLELSDRDTFINCDLARLSNSEAVKIAASIAEIGSEHPNFGFSITVDITNDEELATAAQIREICAMQKGRIEVVSTFTGEPSVDAKTTASRLKEVLNTSSTAVLLGLSAESILGETPEDWTHSANKYASEFHREVNQAVIANA
jgi:hypothetical protein